MIENNLRYRAASAIQSDRLSEFFKRSIELSSGCVYYALLNAYNHLYPNKILPRSIEDMILSQTDLGVMTNEILSEIEKFRYKLGLEVARVDYMNLSDKVEDVRKMGNIPLEIPVACADIDYTVKENDDIAALIYFEGPDTDAHLGSALFSNRFLRRNILNSGGKTEFEFIVSQNYTPSMVIYLQRTQPA